MPLRSVLSLCVVLTLGGALTHARADSDIVFAAEYYRWPLINGKRMPGDVLEAVSRMSLYRADMNGSVRRIFPGSKYVDRCPRWSPDGKKILFWRWFSRTGQPCILDMDSGRVTRIRSISVDWVPFRFGWSPDSRRIAATMYDSHGDSVTLIADGRSGRTQRIPGAEDIAWSPDSKQLYAVFRKPNGDDWRIVTCFYDFPSLRRRRAINAVVNPVWRPDGTIVGDVPNSFGEASGFVSILGQRGQLLRRVKVRLRETQRFKQHGEQIFFREMYRRWLPIPGRRDRFLVEATDEKSDGSHSDCWEVDLNTGVARPLTFGECIGMSPDGKQLAFADDEWAGEYKHGGARCGPLQVLRLGSKGRTRSLTTKLVAIGGGDWRRRPTAESNRPAARSLRVRVR